MENDLVAPAWLKFKGKTFTKDFNVVRKSVSKSTLATVCEAASCPNKTECWSGGTATFMLMGDTCTRGCRFCNVKTSRTPQNLNPNEGINLVEALKSWGQIKYVVITSVDRDDLIDGGSKHLANCIREVKESLPELKIEILIPDFQGQEQDILNIINSKPEVIAHNIETVRRLTPKVRDRRATYDQSLEVLKYIKTQNPRMLTKSSIMLGFGENEDEIKQTLQDLFDVGVDFVTIGQYMRPSMRHAPVKKYIDIEVFDDYKRFGENLGFKYVVSKPLSRSSYKAGELFNSNYLNKLNRT